MNVEQFTDALTEVSFDEYPNKYEVAILTDKKELSLGGVVVDEDRKKLYLYIGSIESKE